MDKVADNISISAEKTDSNLLKAAKTSLGSKIVSKAHDHFAQMAVDAVLSVADMERRDVDFELIKMESKVGGGIEDSTLIKGVLWTRSSPTHKWPRKSRTVRSLF